jgi:hypothetical protein
MRVAAVDVHTINSRNYCKQVVVVEAPREQIKAKKQQESVNYRSSAPKLHAFFGVLFLFYYCMN